MQLSPSRIRDARIAAGLTQAQVYARAGVSDGTYRRLENGRGGPCSAETLARIASVLGVPMESLFGETEVSVG